MYFQFSHGKQKLDNFLSCLNNKEPTINFTIEKEQNQQISFLNILMKINVSNFKTLVYRKLTLK